METPKRKRSRLPKDAARAHYVAIGSMAVLEQIRTDAAALDDAAIAVGPFARIDAGAVAARDGKTRGSITNLFGSQAAFQVEVMQAALDADLLEIPCPDPAGFADAEAWVDAFFEAQAARGPRHGADPEMSYACLWALWLGSVPYGLWSERIAGPAMEEFMRSVVGIEAALGAAVAHFGLRLRPDGSLADLALATASVIEGVWLNQCLTARHPALPGEPFQAAMQRAGRLLWRGAVEAEPPTSA